MDTNALKSIPRRYLSKAVGTLDEVIQTVPEPERPVGGPPLPLRVLPALSWRQKWTAFRGVAQRLSAEQRYLRQRSGSAT